MEKEKHPARASDEADEMHIIHATTKVAQNVRLV
jgi:hypothetical protein